MSHSFRYHHHDSEIVQKIEAEIPCRRTEIQTLLDLFGQKNQYACPCAFVYGHNSTGKSLVVNTLLSRLQFPHAVVNCVECYTARLIYETILCTLSGNQPCSENNYTTSLHCDSMNDFIRSLKSVIADRQFEEETVYIVFDNAERLRDMDANLLPAFLRLQELTNHNVCVVLISEIVWDKFRTTSGLIDPFMVHFSDYSKDDLIDILRLDCPSEYSADFYASYITLVLSVFYIVCRNLKELRHLATLNFPKYIEPIKTGEAEDTDYRKLWKNIQPHLQKALQTVYLREVSSLQWERSQQEQELTLEGLSSRSHIELPFYSKYLLIASYLASYNPAKSDRRFFSLNAGRFSRRSKLVKKSERTSNQLLGPKPFPLDRLMAVFYAIVDGRVAPTAAILSQITSLVSLRLIVQVASDDQLDTPKYKCLVPLDFIRLVARTVQFDVLRHLYDFI